MSAASEPRTPGFWSLQNLWSWTKLIAVILFIKGCVIDQYTIPSESMEPTLRAGNLITGDRVLVNKWIFGPRIPFTAIRLWEWGAPKRWDIVVFKPKPGTSRHSVLIKRVVALPGERVQISNGNLYINGRLEPFPPSMRKENLPGVVFPVDMPDFQYYNDADIMGIMMRTTSIPAKRVLQAMLEQYPLKYGCLEGEEYSRVPEGHYLVLGDNSLHSVDGRIFGWIPQRNLLGRAFAVWWPFSRWQDFTGFSATWWGKGLLYGIPSVLVAWEAILLYLGWRERRARAGGAA
jgi:signal peptidase I